MTETGTGTGTRASAGVEAGAGEETDEVAGRAAGEPVAGADADEPAAGQVERTVVADEDKAIKLGHPSYVWGFGQERRLGLVRRHVPLAGRRILDVGCGIGAYVRAFRRYSDAVHGVDVDAERIAEGARDLPNLQVAPSEHLPFPDGAFDVVFLHEVIEHVDDDRRTLAEAARVLVPGGHVVIFAPNRLFPFETHGAFFFGRYRFGNIPLINYLPDPLRHRLAPHVRVYTDADIRRLLAGLPFAVEVHTHVYPAFDRVMRRSPTLARLARRVLYLLEHTPLHAFGLSHFVVARRLPHPASPTPTA